MKRNYLSKAGQRLLYLGAIVFLFTCAVALLLVVLNKQAVYFFTPSMLSADQINKDVRVGGYIKSVISDKDTYVFVLSDCQEELKIFYNGILPELFVIGGSTIVEGKYDNGNKIIATKVLAKHDENYMPPQLAKTLKKQPCRFPQES